MMTGEKSDIISYFPIIDESLKIGHKDVNLAARFDTFKLSNGLPIAGKDDFYSRLAGAGQFRW